MLIINYLEKITYPILAVVKSIKHGIWNLIKWFPLVWNDRNYDDYYFYKVLSFKLFLIEKEISKGIFVGWEEEVKTIKDIRAAIERILRSEYCKEEWEELDKELGKVVISFENNNGKQVVKVYRHNTETGMITKNITEKEKEILSLENKRQSEDISFVFDTIKNNITKWWT